jgi:uncharacterized membrane protein YjjP (DUF1212 family)
MSDDRTKADKAWEARQEAARLRIFNAATNAAEATDEADDDNYFAVLDQAGNAAEAAAAEITGYNTYADLLEALDTRRKHYSRCGTAMAKLFCAAILYLFVGGLADVAINLGWLY